METKTILKVSNLSKSFGKKNVVKSLNLEVEKGDVFGFLGPNGAGKTTTIRMMLGLIKMNEGEVSINGYNVKTDFSKAIESVGAVVESPKFYEYLSGYDNLKLIANLHKNISKDRINEVLEIVGMKKRAKDKMKTYSLGMKQRLGIARALLNNPQLIILDEPTNGLDPQGMVEVRELIIKLAKEENITFFISTHLLHEVELMCNRVAIINQGETIVQGTVSELLDKDHDSIELITQNNQLAKELIEKLNYAEHVEDTDKGILITLDEKKSGVLNSYLNENGVVVEYLIPKNQSLEEFFIETTEGGNKIA
ncbi:ABC transporter ATP-binding protein [Oceanirhabdus sp. W0125-5]|uniref:ABC transporter ATP-binding protein n=1 Tax=Oceanirhabdus sp. W0125-5 TaxID=2999116 RepID=UPI0022F32669|nr:ABC transporter ATP-binding protein [Oceanirhabdus sp. W0125-5]WBW99105.1 ABC transporter ATP-binding protein [Oceanirhabdus sp. W0125-5]